MSNTQPWFSALCLKCSTTDKAVEVSPLVFEKQVIYAGDFEGEFPFTITEATIDHWMAEHTKLAEHGFKLIVPIEHEDLSEENTKAEVAGFVKRLDDQNRIGLFGKFVFASEKDAALSSSHDVSVYSPPVWELDDGYRAVRPLTHVALTKDPLIPGLQSWKILAASSKKRFPMLKDIADALKLEIPADAKDEDITKMILQAIADLSKPKEPEADPAKAPADAAIAASNMALRKQNRGLLIDALVNSAKLSPAEAAAWKTTYCTDAVIPGFDEAHTLALSRTPIVAPGQKSGSQTPGTPEDSPLVAAAKAAAARAKQS